MEMKPDDDTPEPTEGADPDVHDDEATQDEATTYTDPEPDEGVDADVAEVGDDTTTDDEGAEHG